MSDQDDELNPAIRIRETGHRTVRTYVHLYHAAHKTLLHAKENARDGSLYFLMSAGVFAAFTAEAYFNDLGPRVSKVWEHLERLSPRQKAEVLVMQLLGSSVDWGRRPFQNLGKVLSFRNALAHGRTEMIAYEKEYALGALNQGWPDSPQTTWEEFCRTETVEQVLTDIERVIEMLDAAHEPGYHSFAILSTNRGDAKITPAGPTRDRK